LYQSRLYSTTPRAFQYSSASRKFLNRADASPRTAGCRSFSTLQRAENSSTLETDAGLITEMVSVLFSEPKIPQRRRRASV